MKKLAFTTAIALALATAAYGADRGGHGGPSGGGGGPGGAGFSAQGPAGGFSGSASSFRGGPGGPSGFSGMSRGPASGVYNQGNIQSYQRPGNLQSYRQGQQGQHLYNQGNMQPNREGQHLYNEGDREHGFDRNEGGARNLDRRGIVRGNFFEHGRHFGFRRFFNGQWVFLTDWDSCTAWAWVNVAPGAWAWAPVNVCIG
jgi:hypothetical protein